MDYGKWYLARNKGYCIYKKTENVIIDPSSASLGKVYVAEVIDEDPPKLGKPRIIQDKSITEAASPGSNWSEERIEQGLTAGGLKGKPAELERVMTTLRAAMGANRRTIA